MVNTKAMPYKATTAQLTSSQSRTGQYLTADAIDTTVARTINTLINMQI